MVRKTSNFDGVTRADERNQYALNSIKKALSSLSASGGTLGSGVSFPQPYFPTQLGTTFYWQPDNSVHASVPNPADPTNPASNLPVEDYNLGTDDDNEDGGAVVSWWLIPNDCAVLSGRCRPVKKNGLYGRPVYFRFDNITDDERGMGFCERTIRGLRPGWVYDITRATSTSTSGGVAHNPVEPTKAAKVCPQITAGNTRATSMQAWPNPVVGEPAIGYPPYGTAPHYPLYQNPALPADQGEALARIDLRNYAPLNVRITAVGAAEKDRDGTYWPVTVTFTAGLVDRITLRGFRVGRKGPEDYSKYGKTYRRWRFELSETDRDAGTAVLRVGPFGPQQAKHPWHITRIHAADFKDNTQSRRTHEWYPAAIGDCAGPDDIGIAFAATPDTDLDSAYQKAKSNSNVSSGRVPGAAADGSVTADADDVSAGQAANWAEAQTSDGSVPSDGGAAGKRRVLAVLAPGEQVDGKLGGFVVTTEADLATEKDNDAYIRFSADIQTPAGAASTAGDANATQAVFIFHRNADADARANYIRKRVDLNPTDAKAELTFHRKIGRKFKMKKMRLRNGISKVDTDLSSQTGGGLTAGVFTAGQGANGVYIDTDASTGIGTFSIASITSSNENSPTALTITITIQNNGVGGIPVLPKKLFLFRTRKVFAATTFPGSTRVGRNADSGGPVGDTNWRLADVVDLRPIQKLATLGTWTVDVEIPARRKTEAYYAASLLVAGDDTRLNTSVAGPYTPSTELPNQNYGYGHGNQVAGGGFLHTKKDVDGAGSTSKPALDWEVWDDLTGAGAVDVDTDAGDPIYWDPANRRLIWKFNGGTPKYLACKIPKPAPGKRYTGTMRLRSNSATPDSSTFIGRICSKGVGSLTTPGLHRGVTLNANTGDYVSASTTIDVPNYASGTQGIYYVLDRNGTSDDQDFQITDVALFVGDQALPWEPAGVEANWRQDPATAVTYTDDDAGNYANTGGGGETVPLGDVSWE